jgi:hypothetical protein
MNIIDKNIYDELKLYIHIKNCYKQLNNSIKGQGGGARSVECKTIPLAICNIDTSITDEYVRYLTIARIIDEAVRFTSINTPSTQLDKIKYETKNIVERLLLEWANRATIECSSDPIINGSETYDEYKKDLTYQRENRQFYKFPINQINHHIDQIKKIIGEYIVDKKQPHLMPQWRIEEPDERNDLSRFTLFDSKDPDKIIYERIIKKSRMDMLLSIGGEDAVVKLLIRYASIISGPNHWEAPIEYFRTLYQLGVRFESFSSPINSNFLLDEFRNQQTDQEIKICSLFYDTDKIFGSIGGFFQVDFLSYSSNQYTPIIVVGPPYYDLLILNIAKKIQQQCLCAQKENKSIRFIITHSNSWDYSEGFKILKESEFCKFDHIFKKNEHSYNNDRGEQIVARFETRLFVLDHGIEMDHKYYMDRQYKDDLMNLFPKIHK